MELNNWVITLKFHAYCIQIEKLYSARSKELDFGDCIIEYLVYTVKILKFGTPQTIAIIVPKIEKFDATLH